MNKKKSLKNLITYEYKNNIKEIRRQINNNILYAKYCSNVKKYTICYTTNYGQIINFFSKQNKKIRQNSFTFPMKCPNVTLNDLLR